MNDKKIRNMEEFAAASGISRPTLSKYFDNPERVRPAIRARIEQALKDFDYRPNFFAINQNRRRPKNIGLIVPFIADPFYAEIVRRVEARCAEEGYWAIVLSSHGEEELEARAIETLLSLKLAGAIIAPLGHGASSALVNDLAQTIPVVMFDSHNEQALTFVGNDNRQSISLIVDYLCRTGEPPCFLEMPAVNRSAIERREAYVETMVRLGHEPQLITPLEQSWEFESHGFSETRRLLDGPGFPSATILCANDRLAFGVMAAAFSQGLRVGRSPECDLRVAGHDDHPLSRYTCPALTTVAQDYSGIAEKSVDLLLEMINEPEPSEARVFVQLQASLIMRDSA